MEGCPQPALGSVASGLIDALKDKVKQNIEDVKTGLENLEKYGESSAGPSSGRIQFLEYVRRSRIGRAMKMNYISSALNNVKFCLDQVFQEACNIEFLLERHMICPS